MLARLLRSAPFLRQLARRLINGMPGQEDQEISWLQFVWTKCEARCTYDAQPKLHFENEMAEPVRAFSRAALLQQSARQGSASRVP